MTNAPNHDTLVGTGGWAYFQVPDQDSLRAYASVFNFVEVNSTYYEYPDLRAVSRWRSRVPKGFEFTVRSHQDLVKAIRGGQQLMLTRVLEKMTDICRRLDANILSILLPDNLALTTKNLTKSLASIASRVTANNLQAAVETRGRVEKEVLETMSGNDIVHSVDISKEEPAFDSRILYSRLFGKGSSNVYQFDDEEIKAIADRVASPKFERSILAFHGVRMYGDAARLKAFLQTGRFLKVTGQTGLDSLGTVLKEDAQFPASRDDLVGSQGWKLFDLTIDKRMRVAKILAKAPDRTYRSHSELLSTLEPFLSKME